MIENTEQLQQAIKQMGRSGIRVAQRLKPQKRRSAMQRVGWQVSK